MACHGHEASGKMHCAGGDLRKGLYQLLDLKWPGLLPCPSILWTHDLRNFWLLDRLLCARAIVLIG